MCWLTLLAIGTQVAVWAGADSIRSVAGAAILASAGQSAVGAIGTRITFCTRAQGVLEWRKWECLRTCMCIDHLHNDVMQHIPEHPSQPFLDQTLCEHSGGLIGEGRFVGSKVKYAMGQFTWLRDKERNGAVRVGILKEKVGRGAACYLSLRCVSVTVYLISITTNSNPFVGFFHGTVQLTSVTFLSLPACGTGTHARNVVTHSVDTLALLATPRSVSPRRTNLRKEKKEKKTDKTNIDEHKQPALRERERERGTGIKGLHWEKVTIILQLTRKASWPDMGVHTCGTVIATESRSTLTRTVWSQTCCSVLASARLGAVRTVGVSRACCERENRDEEHVCWGSLLHTHARARRHAHACMHAHTHTHTHTHTRTHTFLALYLHLETSIASHQNWPFI